MSMFTSKNSTEKIARLPQPKHDQVNGLLDKGCSFEGKLTFDGTVQINGDFRGEIFSDGILVIGNDARVRANVFVDTLVIYGKFEGHIEAKSKIEMHTPAVVIADLKTKTLSIQDGVVFQGSCQMERVGELAEKNPEPRITESANAGVTGNSAGSSLPLYDDSEDNENVLVM